MGKTGEVGVGGWALQLKGESKSKSMDPKVGHA